MAIQDVNNPQSSETAQFCADCGSVLAGGRFCPGCGRPVGAEAPFQRHDAAVQHGADIANGHGAVADDVPHYPPGGVDPATEVLGPPAYGSPPEPGPRRRRRWPLAVGAGLLALAAIAAAAIVVLNDRGGSSGPSRTDLNVTYSKKVAATFSPVDAANRRLSDALTALRRGHGSAAQDAVTGAQSTTAAARGALGALTVPDGSQELAAQMRQVIDRESTYLSAVNLALAHPSNPGVAQLQSIAGSLTSTLVAIGDPIRGASENVAGADRLTSWAQRTARAAASRRRAARQAAVAPPAPQPAPTPSNAPTGDVCPSGERVNATTSCAFAENVHSAWIDTPGVSNTVTAYSAATGRDITMDCGPTGGGGTIVCTGGENAFVSW
jgi:hypothetical protein